MNVAAELDVEQALVEHIIRISPLDLGSSLEMATRRELVWAIATAIAGASAPGSGAIHDYALSMGGASESTILGFGDRAPAVMAGLANATYAKAHEYEDKIWIGNTHGYGVGMAVVPTALAVAERIGDIGGDELLAAIAVATDVHARLLAAPVDAIFGKSGWNSAYLFAVFGATSVAAKLLQLDSSTTQNALGLAYAQAAGNYQGQIEGVLGVRMQLGFAVRNAIMAADLAARGITGVKKFLTGRYGLYPLYFGNTDVDLSSVTADLGTDFRGERLGFKGYPCGLVAHPAVDALRSLAGGYSPVEIRAIRVFGDDHLRIMTEPRDVRREPRNFIDAQFSAPWALACAIVDGTVKLQHFAPESLADERYRRLAKLVDIHLEADRGTSCVELELVDGRKLRSADVRVAKGHPDNPLSNAEIAEVFRDCVAFAPNKDSVERAANLADSILAGDPMPGIAQLMEALRPASMANRC